MSNALAVSVLYIVVAVTLTIWLSATLYRNGIELLRERDGQHRALAEATSYLLVIGFGLFTLGYSFLLLQVSDEMDRVTALQFLIQRLGILFVSLGIIHLINTLIFLRFRRARTANDDDDDERPSRKPTRRLPPDPDAPLSEQARRR